MMCLGLQGVVDKAARSNLTCQTNTECDTVNCFVDVFQNGALFPLSMKFNPCKEPRPSVAITLKQPDTEKVSLVYSIQYTCRILLSTRGTLKYSSVRIILYWYY